MPNWCENKLIITGNQRAIARARELIGTPEAPIDFTVVAPEPEEAQDLTHPIPKGVYDWITWRGENWGTKWNVHHKDIIINEEEGKTTLAFDTAWSPPTRWLSKVAERINQEEPDQRAQIELQYYESGIGFAGYFRPQEEETETDTEGLAAIKLAIEMGFIENQIEDIEEH